MLAFLGRGRWHCRRWPRRALACRLWSQWPRWRESPVRSTRLKLSTASPARLGPRSAPHQADRNAPARRRARNARIWVEKRETANRVRGRIETIIAKNVDVDDTDFRNPAELTKQLREKLPKRPKRVVEHHPALPYAEAAKFMADLSAAAGTAAAMLRFVIFTACRTNEVVDARWSEIDRGGFPASA
jgi:integrase